MSQDEWVVMTDNGTPHRRAFLVDAERAAAGAGLNGGWTRRLEKATRYRSKAAAAAIAARLRHGKATRVSELESTP